MVLRSGTERIGASGNNNNDNNNGPLPDPPIQPTLADVLTQQTQLFGHIINQMGNNGNQGQREESQVNKFGDFFRTNPPIFRGSKDPLDVDFWLNTIEEKLGFIQCDQYEKVLFAAHQLHDASGVWWRGFKAYRPANYRFTWEEFRAAFLSSYSQGYHGYQEGIS